MSLENKMTLPKNLQEKKIELWEERKEILFGVQYKSDRENFIAGFNSACNLLLPEIEKMVEALKEISKIKYGLQGYVEENDLQGERDYLAKLAFGYEQAARETLKSWQAFLGEKSEDK